MTILNIEDHKNFLEKISQDKILDFYLSEPSRLNTIYWTINSYKIMNSKKDFSNFLFFTKNCKNQDGGYGGSTNFPSTILSTFNALQILYISKQDFFDIKTVNFILKNFNKNGSFNNDEFGMTDNRINCSAVLSLHLLYLNKNRVFDISSLSKPIPVDFCENIKFDYKSCVRYIMSCYNKDGGFGLAIGDETHCAFTFCCLSVLRSLGGIEYVNSRDISRFICLRQVENGGLSGRINKKEDVCYSFWAYASLKMIKKNHLIDEEKLKEFILRCQGIKGGISDRPGNEPDPYHLMFSLAALSLLGYDGLSPVDPGFAL
ncbi:geranylgeranyl transferase type-2 subunit beta (PGTB2) [Vairimorpha necatrix]|uniref:Geranylgeranyl transferase type-2 subunit beta n=1 Tax=Vairimorpha necatrix TaxID=6039 RepID=A0AAX4JDP4_9MICR